MLVKDIIAAMEAERTHCNNGIGFEVTAARQDGATLIVSVQAKKGAKSTAIDESLEGSRAVWGEAGRGDVFVVNPDAGELVLRFVQGTAPAPGTALRLFPRDFLTPLIELWNDPACRKGAIELQARRSDTLYGELKTLPDCFSTLRERQIDAVNLALRPLSLIIGPPGTGKTFTVGALVAYILKRFPQAKLILTGPTNVSVDTALLAADDWLVRLGRPDLRPTMKRVGSHFDTGKYTGRDHLLAPGLYAASIELKLLQDEEPSRKQLDLYVAWKEKVEKARAALKTDVVALAQSSRVLALTTAATFHHFDALRQVDNIGFTICDEASQVTMPAALMAASLSQRAIFAGDPHQLAPVVQSPDKGAQAVLGKTAFEIFSKAQRVQLNEQSRMCEGICDVVSHTFYARDLVVCRKSLGDMAWHKERSPWFVDGREVPRVLFDDGAGETTWSSKYNGLIRFNSASIIRKIAEELIGSYAEAKDIVVLTPFRAQRALLREMFKGGSLRSIKISTVHRSQGTECSIVLFDPVDAFGAFLSGDNGRRLLNVAFSRAKAHVAVVVNQQDLHNRWLGAMHRRAREVWHTSGNFAEPFRFRV